ncbi:MAG: acyl-CoA thioesterase [Xanthobacteraceae bacterium]
MGTWTLFEAALGVKSSELASVFGIAGIPLVDASARFLALARFGEVVVHSSKVKEFRRTSFDVEHILSVRGAVAVEGRETRVWTSRDANDARVVRPEPIPDAVIARFRNSDSG